MITGLFETHINVRDLQRAIDFYRDVLGLAEIPRPDFPFPGAWFALGDRELHLIGGEEARSQGGNGTDSRQLHFAIRVASFEQALARLRGLGFSEEVAENDPMHVRVVPRPLTGYPQAYVCDPDRHLIEINAACLDG